MFYEQTKHIEIDRHFIKEKKTSDILNLSHVSSEEQLADVFTKGLDNRIFHTLVCKLGMCDIFAPTWGGVLTCIVLGDLI